MKIDRVYELVRTENKTIEEVATERFGVRYLYVHVDSTQPSM